MATSLCEGEAKIKHVGILTLHGNNWDLEKVRLKSVRPFVIQDVELDKTELSSKDASGLILFLHDKVKILFIKIRLKN